MPPKINLDLCTSCKVCYDVCWLDVFGWDEEKSLPTILRPNECWACGACEIDCPTTAIELVLPLACL